MYSLSGHTNAQKKPPAGKKGLPAEMARNQVITSSNSSETPFLYKKASCACGGGCPSCQAKTAHLPVSQPTDALEVEADRMADKVMRMQRAEPPDNPPSKKRVGRKRSEAEEEKLYRKESGEDSISFAPSIVRDVLSSTGKPLDADTRTFMEGRFKYDFGDVKIHDYDLAAKSADSINALAYTSGNNIVFNSGQYNPASHLGKQLLAHELAHVVQQGASGSPSIQRRTYRDTFTTVAFLPGPLWNVHLTITNAPEGDSESLDNFISACHDGVMNAARSLGERPSVTTREIRVRIRFNRRLSESEISQRAFDLAVASLPRPTAPATGAPPQTATRPRAAHIPHDPAEDPRSGETDDQRIRRQTNASLRLLSNAVADAGTEGYSRIVLTIQNNGREIFPGFSKEGQTSGQPAPDYTSAYSVRDLMGTFFDTIVQGSGRWQIVFTRQGNSMSFSSFRVVPEAPATVAMSEEEELRALGIPNRREIYAQIFQETQHQLHEAGVMIAGFAIEQLILYVAGGLLFRGIALLGRGATSAFPKILALISRGSPSALASGLEVLSAAERAEFTALMQRVESGALTTAEQTRLRGFLTRVETALPNATSAAAQVLSRIRIPRVMSLTGSRATFDAELVRRAAELRATQAGLTLEAFTNYNVAVARVRTAGGEIVYLEAGNLPGGLHSEEYILAQLRDRVAGLGARVEQLYSERIPCSNCGNIISRFFGEGTEVYYTVGNVPNRGRELMGAYGL